MKLTPFDIYIWQQADSFDLPIKVAAVSATVLAVVFTVWFFGSLEEAVPDEGGKYTEKIFWRLIKSASAAMVLWSLLALMPSSKTVAMMYVVPAVANSDPIQKDLPELYNMAKEALKDMTTPTAEKE